MIRVRVNIFTNFNFHYKNKLMNKTHLANIKWHRSV